MKKHKKITFIIIIIIILIVFPLTTFAHSGRTDSKGGHRDNKNKSGLGSYHYHCGGNPAHLHENGICPYAPKDRIIINNYDSIMYIGDQQKFEYSIESVNSHSRATITSSDSDIVSVSGTDLTAKNAGTATITIKTSTTSQSFDIIVKEVYAEDVEISILSNELQVGSKIEINSTISPYNTTNKDITYTSSDNDIATVTADGEIEGISSGTVTITATTSNDISESVDIRIFEVFPEEINCKNSISLVVGEVYDLQIQVLPEICNNKDYIITSNDEEILKYSNNSLEAIKKGETSINIETWNGIKKEVPVKINIVSVENIKIIDSTKYILFNIMDKSDKVVLTPQINPSNATYQDGAWSSSNNNIVSIENDNFVINGVGKVTLTYTVFGNIFNSIDIVIVDKKPIILIIVMGMTIILIVFIKKKKLKKDN